MRQKGEILERFYKTFFAEVKKTLFILIIQSISRAEKKASYVKSFQKLLEDEKKRKF